MLWTFTAFILRRLWGYIFVILVFAGLVGLVVLAYWFWPQWTAGDFDKRTRILEILMLASGALSIIMLAAQLRQQAAWNKVLSFHEYFSDVPSPDNVVALHATFRRLNIELPNYADPLSDANSDLIIGDTTVDANIGNGRRARVIVQAYLDDLEEFCAAVNAGIVSDSYARDIEGTRTIRAFFAFEKFITKLRMAQQELAARAQLAGTAAQSLRPFRSKYYEELERVARRWKIRREGEHNVSLGMARMLGKLSGIGPHV